ncbi:MAG: hypothetical protein ACM3U2_15515, partial [Deltaproteobacteria bacterium]
MLKTLPRPASLEQGSVACIYRRHGEPANDRWARWLWTAACLLLWIHAACAFQIQHHWSHAEAYAHTTRQTEEFVGLEWGGGLYFQLSAAARVGRRRRLVVAGAEVVSRSSAARRLVLHRLRRLHGVQRGVRLRLGFQRWLPLDVMLILTVLAVRRGATPAAR